MMFPTFDIPLRPLLYAAEIAAAAAGVYFLFKKRRYRVLQMGSGVGAVRALDPGLMCDTDEGRDAQRCSAEPEVLEQMELLLSSVQQLTKEVLEIRSTAEQINSERQREQEAYRILRAEYDEMRKALKNEDDPGLPGQSQDVQLEDKILDLGSQLNKDHEHEKNLHEQLIGTYGSEEISLLRKLDPITAVAAKTQQRSNEETEIVLRTRHSNARLSDILKEHRLSCKQPKNQQNSALKTIEEQKLDYDQICLREQELFEGHNILKEKHSELLKYEQEHETHNNLKLQCEQMMKKDADKKNLLMMEKENLDLKGQVGKLVEKVWRMEVMLSRTDEVCRAMKKERERLREAHHISNFVYKKSMKQCDDLLREIENKCWARSTLKEQDNKMMEVLKQCNKSQNMDHLSQEFKELTAGGGV
ncbi:protein lava lamp-like isoform X2 [Silurus meridionalis]|uniref:protein lava lamp-like isoform X2 n=1 Tax=Silurus meridionalis TaxID=175797 RepID=UPI001EEC39CD|nr:protein lava lamp-like isoform X2 [Silurus meridionalis]